MSLRDFLILGLGALVGTQLSWVREQLSSWWNRSEDASEGDVATKNAEAICARLNEESEDLFARLQEAMVQRDAGGVGFFQDRIAEVRHQYEEAYMNWVSHFVTKGMGEGVGKPR